MPVQDSGERIRRRAAQINQQQTAGAPNDLVPSLFAGAGAGWLFGPAGGLAALGLTKYLTGKQREGAAARAAIVAESTEAAAERGRNFIRILSEQAETPKQQATVDAYSELFEGMMARGDIDGALGMLPGFDNELDEDMQEARDQLAGQRSTALDIYNSLEQDSKPYTIRAQAWRDMQAVEDTNWGDQTLMVNAFKLIDPNSAVMQGEVGEAQNLSGVPDWLRTAFVRVARDGGRLSPQERVDILRQSGLIYGQARAAQIERNEDAVNRGRALGVGEELAQSVIPVPVLSPEDVPFPRQQGPDSSAIAANMGLAVARDENGIWRVYEPEMAGEKGFAVLDLPLVQDTRGQAGQNALDNRARRQAEGQDADLREDGSRMNFLEALFTPGAVDARVERNKRDRERGINR